MKLSFIFELLLIFVLIAFAASAVIDSRTLRNGRKALKRKHNKNNNQRQDSANKYCSCSTKLCNCCREFNIPVVSLQGPGCASLQYLQGDRLAISMSFGERVLTNTTVSSKKPQPVCMPLPGGVSKFCGRVYNIARKGQDFNACLGLELRALKDVEAALRVACFRFGPNGLRVQPSQPLPPIEVEEDEDDDEDDDDDDDFDFDDDDDDEDEDDDDNDVDSVDYGTFSVFDDDFIGEYFTESSAKKKKTTTTTTFAPVRRVVTRKPARINVRRPTKPLKIKTKPKPVVHPKPSTTSAPAKLQSTEAQPQTTSEFTIIMETTAVPQELTESTNQITNSPIALQSSEVPQSLNEVTNGNVEIQTSTLHQQLPEIINEVTNIPSLLPHESIAAVTAILQNYPEEEGLEQAVSNPEPVHDFSLTTNPTSVITTVLPSESTTYEATETTTIDITTEVTKSNSEEEDDPITDVLEEVIDDEINSAEVTTKISKNMTVSNEEKEPKDVFEDIVNGMVDPFGEDSDEETNNQTSDDDDDDDDEEDDDARNARRRIIQKQRGRQSRDMWLDRLHW